MHRNEPMMLRTTALATMASEVTPASPPHSDSADAVIRVHALTKRYGPVTVVDGVTFTVSRGEVFGFLGPNGAGKSTTIGMLLGLIRPTAGQVDLFGRGPDQHALGLARTGAIIETPAFYPYLSGRDNLRALAQLRPGVTMKRVDAVLEVVGLQAAADKRFAHYSLGMKQRLGIGWSLLHDPDLLILDEPTNGLDPAGMREIRQLMVQLAEQGTTIFISSHLLHEVEQICNRVAIIQRGRVVADGFVRDLLQRDRKIVVRVDDPTRAAAVIHSVPGVRSVEGIETSTGQIEIDAPGVPPATINAALVGAGLAVDELGQTQASLEHVFLELTDHEPADHAG